MSARSLLIAIAWITSVGLGAHSRADLVISEDFDTGYTGSAWPGTALEGQNGWTMVSGGLTVRDDFTAPATFDGNVAFGIGQGYRNYGSSFVTASDTALTLQFSGRVGNPSGSVNDRYSRFGLGYFDGSELNIGVYFGAFGQAWGVALGSGTSAGSALAQSADGYSTTDVYPLMRLSIDLVTETGTFEYDNGGGWTTPSGMSSIDFSTLSTSATDGQNPLNWNSFYIRNIGAGDTLDALSLTVVPEPSSLAFLLIGVAALFGARARPSASR